MSFDEADYWKKRSEGKRGQGETVKLASRRLNVYPRGLKKASNKKPGKYAIRKNTRRARKATARAEDASY